MARKEKDPDAKPGRLKQFGQAYQMTAEAEPLIWLWLLLAFAVPFVVVVVIGLVIGHPWLFGLLAFMVGLSTALIVLGRRAERAAYGRIEGQTGAASSALNLLKRGWTVSPAIAVSKNADLVHRVVGRPGVILVGEGNPNRVSNLLNQERRKVARVAPDVTITEVVAGNGDGQVPLRKLARHISKLPKTITNSQVNELNLRLKALTAQQGSIPIPKGPMPKSARQARGMQR